MGNLYVNPVSNALSLNEIQKHTSMASSATAVACASETSVLNDSSLILFIVPIRKNSCIIILVRNIMS